MREFSTGELVRKVGDVTHAASSAPVTITHHRKPRYVLMTMEMYEELRKLPQDPRQVFTAGTVPPEIAEWVVPQLEAFISGQGNYDD
jgi:hypothetical protein